MRLLILGCHSPYPGADQATPGYLLQADGKNILIDCGTGVVAQLQKHLAVKDLHAVVISHLHPDHSADLIPLGFAAMQAFLQGELKEPIPVFMPPGGTELFLDLANRLGNLAGQLSQGLAFRDYSAGELDLVGFKASFFPTHHAMQCHGIRLQAHEGGTFAYTADTRYMPELVTHMRNVDILLAEAAATTPEHAARANHLLPHEAGKLAAEANVGNLVVTHFLPHTSHEALHKAVEPVYHGVLHIAAEGMVVEL